MLSWIFYSFTFSHVSPVHAPGQGFREAKGEDAGGWPAQESWHHAAAHPPRPGPREGEEGDVGGARKATGPSAALSHKMSNNRYHLTYCLDPCASLRAKEYGGRFRCA